MSTLDDFKAQIAVATTKDELGKISYAAFTQDLDKIFNGKLAARVDALCMLREVELGFLPNDPGMIKKLKDRVRTGKIRW